jgi:transposase
MPGIGPLTASAITASVASGHEFSDGRQFAAWLGLVPRQHSTGGKTRLGRITKRGDAYLRTLLMLGARAVLQKAPHKTDRLSRWALALRERRGYHRAVIAIAAKNARIIWAMLAKERFRPGPLTGFPQPTSIPSTASVNAIAEQVRPARGHPD